MDARIIVEPLSFKLWNSTENDIKLPRVLRNKVIKNLIEVIQGMQDQGNEICGSNYQKLGQSS